MAEIRTFLNSDVPQIVELWNRQPPLDGRLQPISAAMLELHVFSKLYFDPKGLILAEGGGRITGLALCGFAPNQSGSALDLNQGILSYFIVDSAADNSTWPAMWHAVRAYFRANQTSTVHFGSKFPDSPFLAGFYGGTFSPGVFETDAMIFEKLTAAGFRPQPSVDILRLALTNFKPPVERRIIIAKRNYELRVSPDPPPESWWENNLAAFRHQLDFRMLHRKSNRPCGLVSFCNSRPQDAGWDSRYFGMRRIRVDDDLQRSGLGQAMLLDALKDLCQRGVVEIEAQVPRDNIACQSMLKKVGFCPVASATQMQLALDGP